MTELQELYQEIVLEHNWHPRNFRKLEHPTCSAHGFNPFCGDTVNVYAEIRNDVIEQVTFEAAGCAISKASASMMTEAVTGKSPEDALKIFGKFHEMVTHPHDGEVEDDEDLGDLVVLAGVSAFPTRIKCAVLAWHALKGALNGEQEVSTE